MPFPPLVAELKAQTGQFLTKMGEAKNELRLVESEGNSRGSAFAAAIQKHFTAAGENAKGLTGQLGKMVTGLGETSPAMLAVGGAAVAAAAGIAGMIAAGVGKFESQTAEVRKLKAALGSTAEEASGMRNVAVGLGIDVDALSKGTAKLSVNLQKTSGDLAGVHVETAHNADGTANLVKTWDNLRAAYQSIQDPQQKNIFLQQALAKGGIELRGVLSATDAEYQKLKSRGPIYSDKDVQSARDLSIAQRELGASVSHLETDLARGLVPILTTVNNALSSSIDYVDRAASSHSAWGTVLRSVGSTALATFTFGLSTHTKATKESGQATEEARAKYEDQAAALRDFGIEVGSADEQQSVLNKDQQAAVAQAEKYKQKIDDMGAAVTAASLLMGQSADSLSAKQRNEAKAFDAAKDAADHLKQGLDILVGVHITAEQASIAWQQAIADSTAKLKENKASLDITTATGRENETQIIAMIQAGLAHVDALQREGASSQQVTAAYADHVQALKNVMHQAGYTEGQIADLITQYGLVPNLVETRVAAYGLEYLNDSLDGIRRKLNALDGRTVTTYTNNVSVYHDDVSHGLATGGIIGMATGGRIPRAAAGFLTRGPTLVGEGNPAYPEYVIPTDPKYRGNANRLAARAIGDLGWGGSSGGGGGTTVVHYAPQLIVQSATGDLPDSTIRKLREQLFAMGNDIPSANLLPGAA